MIPISDISKKMKEVVDTGSIGLNHILGRVDDEYGLPRSCVVEVFGPYCTGKSALAAFIAKNVIDNDGSVLYFDVENKLDLSYLERIGISSELPVSRFGVVNDEYIMDDVIAHVADNLDNYDLIVVDTVSSLCTTMEAEDPFGTRDIGQFVHSLDRVLSFLSRSVTDKRATVLLLNQARHNFRTGHGYVSAFEDIVSHHAHIRMDIHNVRSIKEEYSRFGHDVVGYRLQFNVLKNSRYIPNGVCQLNLLHNGFDIYLERLEMCIEHSIVIPVGRKYYWAHDAEMEKFSIDEILEQMHDDVVVEIINDRIKETERVYEIKEHYPGPWESWQTFEA